MAAPTGNQNAAKAKIWQLALKRALSRYSGKDVDAGLDKLADKVVKAAMETDDQWPIMEIANRCDGKPAQSVSVSGEEGGPPILAALIRFEEPEADSSDGG